MDQENRGLRTSLACLEHPLTLLSIAVLLLNDHVLKAAIPSWFTGKLSDFAGLFFFPFVVAAGLSLLLKKSRLATAQVGYLSFGSVAIWFVALKTSAAANFATAQFASALLGRPSRFVLDPTDLIALAALLPSWLLWNRRQESSSRRIGYAALCVGAIAAMATSPAPPPTVIEGFTLKDGAVYVVASSAYWGFVSHDAGATWEACDAHACPNRPSAAQLPAISATVCDPISSATCYRTSGKPLVEVSRDGGKTWSAAWNIPSGRVPYLERNGGMPTPRGMIIVEGPSRYILIAMGHNGILRRILPDGVWEQISIADATAVPLVAPDIGEALNTVWSELAIWAGISTLVLIVAGFLVWMAMMPERFGILRLSGWILLTIISTAAFMILGIAMMFGLFLIAVEVGYRVPLPEWLDTTSSAFGSVALGALIALLLSWYVNGRSVVRKTVRKHEAQLPLLLICISMPVGCSILAAVFWPLWALGVIWNYNDALALTSAGTALVAGLGGFLIRRATARLEDPWPGHEA